MARPFRSTAALAVATSLLLAACSTDEGAADDGTDEAAETATTSTAGDSDEGAEPADDQESTTTTAPLPATDELGPYAVGRRTVTVTDPARDGRELLVDLWYPTDVTDDGPLSTYEFIPGIAYDSEIALAAPAVSADGPFPLVVYSHGSGGLRYVAGFHTELLASHGFVVAAPDHVGNTVFERFLDTSDPTEVIQRNRPADVSTLITALIDGNGEPALDEVGAVVDPEAIGVSGHSFGGFTALAIGGGQGETTVPDERVSAVVAMAPATGALSDEDLAAVDVATLLISGTDDTTTPIDDNTTRAAAAVTGRPLLRVDIDGAGHQSFTDVCDYAVLVRELPDIDPAIIEAIDTFAVEGCSEAFLDVDEVHAITNRYTTAFFLSELAGDTDAAAILTADAAADLDAVTFERTD